MTATGSHRRVLRLSRLILPVLLAGGALWLFSVGVSTAASMGLPEAIVHDQVVAATISQVTTQTLEYELAGLTGERPVIVAGSLYTIATRYTYQTEAISMATRYAYEQLAATGLAVTYHDYEYIGYPLRNVIAEKPGVVDPDQVYLITAHLDDLPSGDRAPGADDNGTGSVAVLMAARLLAPQRFAYTLRFVLFTGEEQGLRGSDAYAAACAARGEDIQGVVNLDMIGYNTGEPVYDAYARSGTEPGAAESRQLADLFGGVVEAYALDLIPRRIDMNIYPLQNGSDQWSFLKRGYPAFMVIEDYAGKDFTPFYHTVSDTLSTVDLDYYADLTRAAIATIAHLGRLLPGGYFSGTVVGLEAGQPLSGATVAAIVPTYVYTFTALTDAGGAYSLSLPVGSYVVTVSATFPGYYPAVVTDVVDITTTVAERNFALEPWLRLYLPVIMANPFASSPGAKEVSHPVSQPIN